MSTRVCSAILLLWLLLPALCAAFVYEVAVGGFLIEPQASGLPVVWTALPIRVTSHLGAPWDDAAYEAMSTWNAEVPLFLPTPDGAVILRWATEAEAVDGWLAITHKVYHFRTPGEGGSGPVGVTSATVLLNPGRCWAIYPGPLQVGVCQDGGRVHYDLTRVVLHELGHVLGLAHPEDAGQTQASIMHGAQSDLDTLTADDAAGVRVLYPATAPQTAGQARTDGGSGGGCTLRPQARGEWDTLIEGALVLLGGILWRRRRTWDRT